MKAAELVNCVAFGDAGLPCRRCLQGAPPAGIFWNRRKKLLIIIHINSSAVQAGTPMTVAGEGPLLRFAAGGYFFCSKISPPEAARPKGAKSKDAPKARLFGQTENGSLQRFSIST